MIIKFNYKGLINYGNIGDDIFLPLTMILFKEELEKQNIKFNEIKQGKNIKSDKTINITGGGSLIHSNQTNFTNFSKNNNKYFLFGTGMTDKKLCKLNENNIFDFIDNTYKYAFINSNIRKNLVVLENFRKNNLLFGGFRGLFENGICVKNGFKFNYINDFGILCNQLMKEQKLISNVYRNTTTSISINKERKIVLLNIINIFGDDAFKNPTITYEQYNMNINNLFVIFGVYLIERGYSILLMPFHYSKKELEYTEYVYSKIVKKIKPESMKYVMKYCKYNLFTNLQVLQNTYIAVGVRLHCNIICNSFNIPTVNLCYGVKGINYSITNNLQKYIIPTFNKYLTLDNLKIKFADIEKNYKDIQMLLQEIKNTTFTNVNNEIKKMFGNEVNKFKKFNIILEPIDKTNYVYYFQFI